MATLVLALLAKAHPMFPFSKPLPNPFTASVVPCNYSQNTVEGYLLTYLMC